MVIAVIICQPNVLCQKGVLLTKGVVFRRLKHSPPVPFPEPDPGVAGSLPPASDWDCALFFCAKKATKTASLMQAKGAQERLFVVKYLWLRVPRGS